MRDICVVLQEGNKIRLQGVARSYHAKQIAQHLLLGVVGKMPLVNEIVVGHDTDLPEPSEDDRVTR